MRREGACRSRGNCVANAGGSSAGSSAVWLAARCPSSGDPVGGGGLGGGGIASRVLCQSCLLLQNAFDRAGGGSNGAGGFVFKLMSTCWVRGLFARLFCGGHEQQSMRSVPPKEHGAKFMEAGNVMPADW